MYQCFTANASRALTKSHSKSGILQDILPPHYKNRKYGAIYNHVMQYNVLDKGCLNCVMPEMPVPRMNRKQMTRSIFKLHCLRKSKLFLY